MTVCYSGTGTVLRAVLWTAFAGLITTPSASAAEQAAAPAKTPATAAAEAPAATPGKIALPTKENPLIITITPEFTKALKGFKAEVQIAKPRPKPQWSPAEVVAAKARCAAILKRVHAVVIPETPMKEGACGAAAPVELISIGQNPQVSLSPPATLSCEMVEALSEWTENDLQPLAKKHLGAPLIKIEVMSSYSCRNAYGRKKSKLSEHALANALDIRGFVTGSAKTASVLDDWGKPQREIIAELKAAKAAAAKAEAIKAEAEKVAARALIAKGKAGTAAPPAATALNQGAPGLTRSTILDGIPSVTVSIPGTSSSPGYAADITFQPPNKLGGPLTSATAKIDKRLFLQEAHRTACQVFSTTLGPEANAAHRNHFHVDMAVRKSAIKICE